MKSVKQIAFAALLTLGAFGAVTLVSCNKDDDSACPSGYEGSDCKTLIATKFVGVYTGTEICDAGNDSYTITITANSDLMKINMVNLYNENISAVCTITGSTTFSFSSTQSGATFAGTGTVTGNALVVDYDITNGSTTNGCKFTGSK